MLDPHVNLIRSHRDYLQYSLLDTDVNGVYINYFFRRNAAIGIGFANVCSEVATEIAASTPTFQTVIHSQ